MLRIIGGAWRGRKWRFPEGADIRPTPDRVRETLFNWLGGRVQGARCLDLFAGSGALGLEALSRGAAHVSFIDSAESAVRELRLRLAEWQAGDARSSAATRSPSWRAALRPSTSCSWIRPLLPACWRRRQRASPNTAGSKRGALIYVECAAAEQLPPLPASWQALKAKRAGEVGYHLYARSGA